MKLTILIFITLTTFLLGCSKSDETILHFTFHKPTINKTPVTPPNTSKAILVDATRDGGVWWYPQSSATGFSSTNDHQGKNLAYYLRGFGYQVDELPRGTVITKEILSKYSNIIRAGGFGNYTQQEIAAYEAFLSVSSSLLLLQDHLTNFTNDQLSVHLGVMFEGAQAGTITSFVPHPVTAGVTSFPYMMGSVIRNPDASKITVVGYLQETTTGESSINAVMGILNHPTSKIFFIGDVNGLETIAQPFTSNLVNWLFR